MSEFSLEPLKQKMDASIEAFKRELSSLRTGRASVNLLDHVVVEAYNQTTPLNQLGTVSVADARTLSVHVWDKNVVNNVKNAILDAHLGLNPHIDGQFIRIPLPELTAERRKELVKIAAKYAETARISVRNIRRAGMDALKGGEEGKKLPDDTKQRLSDEIQRLTDQNIKKIDEFLVQKEKEITHV